MNKEFIPYEQALELKDLGFDEECLASYRRRNQLMGCGAILFDVDGLDKNCIGILAAPLYQQAFRFFREKYELTCWVYNSHMDRYYYTILQYGRLIKANAKLETYEEAEHACLLKLIELAKQK